MRHSNSPLALNEDAAAVFKKLTEKTHCKNSPLCIADSQLKILIFTQELLYFVFVFTLTW